MIDEIYVLIMGNSLFTVIFGKISQDKPIFATGSVFVIMLLNLERS